MQQNTLMSPQARTKPVQGPLSKQLANITSTLAQASKRRDMEVEMKTSREGSRTSTPAPLTPIQKPLVAYLLSSPPNFDALGDNGWSPVGLKPMHKACNGRSEDVNMGNIPTKGNEDGEASMSVWLNVNPTQAEQTRFPTLKYPSAVVKLLSSTILDECWPILR
jgi:hypothetical protein